MSATATGYLASKPRYEILDGLRGVAAMIVVAFHLLETYSKGPAYQVLNHGYLAIDFFFVLSGFVIGYAYDDRWNRMSLKGFFKRRLVRLHPMVIMGSLIGALFFYFGAAAFPMIAGVQWWEVLLICLLGCTMLPALPSWDIRGWGETSPLNGPAWSLLYEYIANILYALVIRRFPKFVLGLFVAGAAVLTLDLTLNLDLFGLLSADRSAAYTVIGGWSVTPEQIYIGFSRLLYPFFAGLLLSRLGAAIRVRGGFWWCSLLIAAALVMPHVGSVSTPWIDGGYQALVILFVFPLIVSMGGRKPCRRRPVGGRLHVPRRNLLPALHHPLPAGLYADGLGGRESRRSARHGHFRECRDFPACRRSGLGLPETLRPARPRVAQAALADEVGCGSFRHTGRSPRSGGDLPVLRRMASAQRAEMPGEA